MSKRLKKSCGTCALKLGIDESKLYVVRVKCRTHGLVPFRRSCLDHETMNCTNCRFQKGRIKVDHKRERTDNGDIHFKYTYVWTIYCSRYDDKITTTLEGTKHKATIPTCSLWEGNG